MKLAKVIYSAEGVWHLVSPSGSIRRPSCGTTVQYEYEVSNGVFRVYFPGVRGYAPIEEEMFNVCFRGLDDETS